MTAIIGDLFSSPVKQPIILRRLDLTFVFFVFPLHWICLGWSLDSVLSGILEYVLRAVMGR